MQPPHFKPSQNERLLLVVRQSPLRLVIALLGPALLIIGAFFMLFPLFARGTIGIVIFSAALIVGCGWLIRSLAVWYYRSLTVTTKRIIDVDQQKLFRRIGPGGSGRRSGLPAGSFRLLQDAPDVLPALPGREVRRDLPTGGLRGHLGGTRDGL